MDGIMEDMDEVLNKMFSIDVNNLKTDDKEIYYNRYVLYNNKSYSDIEIIFNKFSMYLNLKILSKFSDFFNSKKEFLNGDKIIVKSEDIFDDNFPLQQTLTWFYFQYKDIIRPINYDYVSLFYLNDYLLMCEKFLIQIIDMISEVKNNPIFYTKLYEGFKKKLLDENIIINIHKSIMNRDTFFESGFIINGYQERRCNDCSYNVYKYCCKKCYYCESHCTCKNINHSIIYILPTLWLTTICEHNYPINIINFRKSINQNIYNQKININYKEVDELLCEIDEYIDEIKVSIDIIFGKIINQS